MATNADKKFYGLPEEADQIGLELQTQLVKRNALQAIDAANPAPSREDFKSDYKYKSACVHFNSTNTTACVTMVSLIAPGSHLYRACESHIAKGEPKRLYEAILSFYSAKTLAKALETVTSICRLIKNGNGADPCLAYGKLISQLSHICSMVPPAERTAEDIRAHEALLANVLIHLTPYAMSMLDSEQVRYMGTFVHMHINTIKRSVCDVSFREIHENYTAYCASSEEYRTQQAASSICMPKKTNVAADSHKRKAESDGGETTKMIKAMVTKAVQGAFGGRGGGRTADRGKGGRGNGGRGPSPMTLLPFADRCARCVAAYVKKNPGTPAEQARVNHKGNECRKMADEHANHTQANMAVVSTSLPEGVTAFMAGTTGLCYTYHKFYIDSGANAVIVNRYYRHLMYDAYIPTVDTSIEGIGNETNLNFELIGKIRFMDVELHCVYAPNISKSVLSVSVLCSTLIVYLN